MAKTTVEQLQQDLQAAWETASIRLGESIMATAKIVAAGSALTGEIMSLTKKPLNLPKRKAAAVKAVRKPRRKLSAAARKRISDAQKKRWAVSKKIAKAAAAK